MSQAIPRLAITTRWALLAALCSMLCTHSRAAAREDNELKLQTERVIVFKDGFCLVVKNATATTDETGAVFTEEVPSAAVLGSFWASSESAKIKSMVAGWREVTPSVTRQCESLADILRANAGTMCSFETIHDKEYEGRIERVVGSSSPRWFVLRTSDGDDVTIEIEEVRGLRISAMEHTLTQKTGVERRKRLSLHTDKPNAEVTIQLMYFRPDVRWIPTYRVELTDQQTQAPKGYEGGNFRTAKLSMQAELLNDAEDLTNVPIHIVVGVPNFRFKDTPSPLTLESTMRQTLPQARAAQVNMNNFSNAVYGQQVAADTFGSSGADATAGTVPAELSQSTGNDLVVYELEPMTLLKGERATVPIASDTLAYRDIYTWDIDVLHSETPSARDDSTRSPLQLSGNKVWRQVELVNSSNLPWTTGAVMFVDGFQPLGQELLTYTSPGQFCRVPVTVAVDLQGKAVDEEQKRVDNGYQWRGRKYLRIDGSISLDLLNTKQEEVPVEVRLRFGGKGKDASDGGDLTLSAFRQEDWAQHQGDRVNQSSTVRWKTSIKPGECFKPTTDYEFLMQF
ncbi:MAG: hypothetical protein Aurels2KO_01070 [Aureliella sp.]